MKIILIGNYKLDKQESMERFAKNHSAAYLQEGMETMIWRPVVFLGKLGKSGNKGIGKWLGYLDKWILFPVILRYRLHKEEYKQENIRFHICDHSNAPYLTHLPKHRTIITCHDVLAIRGALGHEDAYCPASPFGKILQKWILKNLGKARKIACISSFTYNQLSELTHKNAKTAEWKIIYNLYKTDYVPVSENEKNILLEKAGISPTTPFLLHVGSGLKRKNRKLLIDMLAALGDRWNGKLCFAGEALESDLISYAVNLGLTDRVISIVKPDNATLRVLYSACDAFVFPSFSEGFGLPVIEAQACGAPVISSNYDPMPEASGGAALHADPTNPYDFANAYLKINNVSFREELISRGFQNCSRFEPGRVIKEYIEFIN